MAVAMQLRRNPSSLVAPPSSPHLSLSRPRPDLARPLLPPLGSLNRSVTIPTAACLPPLAGPFYICRSWRRKRGERLARTLESKSRRRRRRRRRRNLLGTREREREVGCKVWRWKMTCACGHEVGRWGACVVRT